MALKLSEPINIFNDKFPWFKNLLETFHNVYTELGHGLAENLYQRAICVELAKQKTPYDIEKNIHQIYKNEVIGAGRLDILVNDECIVEIKAIKTDLRTEDVRQLQNYLIQFDKKFGICINFPKDFQSHLSLVVLFHSSLVGCETSHHKYKNIWNSFTIRLTASPKEEHKITSHGIINIGI